MRSFVDTFSGFLFDEPVYLSPPIYLSPIPWCIQRYIIDTIVVRAIDDPVRLQVQDDSFREQQGWIS